MVGQGRGGARTGLYRWEGEWAGGKEDGGGTGWNDDMENYSLMGGFGLQLEWLARTVAVVVVLVY